MLTAGPAAAAALGESATGDDWLGRARSAVDAGDLEEARHAYREVLATGDPALRDRATHMLAWTELSLGNPEAARDELVALLLRLERRGEGRELLYDESVTLLARSLRLADEGDPLAGPWIGRRPDFVEPALRRLAAGYERNGSPLAAARTLALVAKRFPGAVDVAAIRERAASLDPIAASPPAGSVASEAPPLHSRIESLEGSAADPRELLAAYREASVKRGNSSAPLEDEHRFRLGYARAAFAAGEFAEASARAGHLSTDRSLAAELRRSTEQIHAAAIFRQAQAGDSRPLYQKVLRLYPDSAIAPAARLALGERQPPAAKATRRRPKTPSRAALLARFESLRIEAPFAETLARKQGAFQAAIAACETASASQEPTTAAAAWQDIGRLYESFAEALSAVPRPAELAPEERRRYDERLEERVRPLRREALSAYRRATEIATQAGLDSNVTTRAKQALAEETETRR